MFHRELPLRLAVVCLLSAASASAGDVGYVSCPSGEGYVYLYQSVDSFQVLANLKCGEKVEIVDPRNSIRVKVKTVDGKQGYLPQSAITATAPGTQQPDQQALSPSHSAPPPTATPVISRQQRPETPEFSASSVQAFKGKHMIPRGSRVYIEPMGGFESTLAAAFDKKQVPLVIVTDKTQAEYAITGTTEEKKHSTGQKVGMTILLGWGGAAITADQMKGSLQIIDLKTSAIVYAYTATKGDRAQSVAEACAKHVKSEALAP